MKIAFVNCWTMPGGVLNVLEDMMIAQLRKHGKSATIVLFTLIADRNYLEIPCPDTPKQTKKIPIIQVFPRGISWLFRYFGKKKIKRLSRIFDYRNLIVIYPWLMRRLSYKLKKRKPDEIQISSFAIAKNITPIPWVPTHLYLHSPMQYIWSHYEEYNAKLKGRKHWLFNSIVPKLRTRDQSFTHFDSVTCNSHYTQQLAQEIYGVQSTVAYPRIADKYSYAGVSSYPMPYCVYVGRLVNFVRETGLIIQLFNRLHLPLVVIWSWPDEDELKALAGDSIIFTGRNPQGMTEIIRDSAGLINLTKESFWIGTVEALMMGVPVFGFAEGATPELVDADSGMLVAEKSLAVLEPALRKFLATKRDRKAIASAIRKKLK